MNQTKWFIAYNELESFELDFKIFNNEIYNFRIWTGSYLIF